MFFCKQWQMQTTPKSHKESYTPRFNIDTIQYAEIHSNTVAAWMFNVPEIFGLVAKVKSKKENYLSELVNDELE